MAYFSAKITVVSQDRIFCRTCGKKSLLNENNDSGIDDKV